MRLALLALAATLTLASAQAQGPTTPEESNLPARPLPQAPQPAAATEAVPQENKNSDTQAPAGYDWGLVRAYFTLGALISQQDNQFSHTDMFLAFHIDKTYLKMAWPTAENRIPWPGIHTFFETRLTALPVAVKPCPLTTVMTPATGGSPATTVTMNSPGTTCSNASTSASTPGSGTGTGTGGMAPAAADSQTVFLNSQKTARLQFGLYLPIALHPYTVIPKTGETKSYTLFIAPLIKTGLDTSLNGLNQTQQQTATPVSVQPIGNSNQFYKFYDAGFRLGHFELDEDDSVAHHLLSYLDVTWGRFSNMPSILCPTANFRGDTVCTPLTTTSTSAAGVVTTTQVPFSWTHDYRLNVEGLLEVPATKGLSIGFSANVAPNGIQPNVIKGVNVTHIRPQDDLRFLFAYKIDISTIATKLAKK